MTGAPPDCCGHSDGWHGIDGCGFPGCGCGFRMVGTQ